MLVGSWEASWKSVLGAGGVPKQVSCNTRLVSMRYSSSYSSMFTHWEAAVPLHPGMYVPLNRKATWQLCANILIAAIDVPKEGRDQVLRFARCVYCGGKEPSCPPLSSRCFWESFGSTPCTWPDSAVILETWFPRTHVIWPSLSLLIRFPRQKTSQSLPFFQNNRASATFVPGACRSATLVRLNQGRKV